MRRDAMYTIVGSNARERERLKRRALRVIGYPCKPRVSVYCHGMNGYGVAYN